LSHTGHGLSNHVETGLKGITTIKANGTIETIGGELQFTGRRKHLVGGKATGNGGAVNLDVVVCVDIVIKIQRETGVTVSVKREGREQVAQHRSLIDHFSQDRAHKFSQSGLSFVSDIALLRVLLARRYV